MAGHCQWPLHSMESSSHHLSLLLGSGPPPTLLGLSPHLFRAHWFPSLSSTPLPQQSAPAFPRSGQNDVSKKWIPFPTRFLYSPLTGPCQPWALKFCLHPSERDDLCGPHLVTLIRYGKLTCECLRVSPKPSYSRKAGPHLPPPLPASRQSARPLRNMDTHIDGANQHQVGQVEPQPQILYSLPVLGVVC